ncbi:MULTISPECIES: hypothetical protein [Streptomyces]|uniref:hypothetical protein n=1 Tax=Streptomyces TaxID=1883 RepID=UPI003698DCE5|nr:hypothetical protein OG844_33770 [Streptomyces sp. NBC_00887]
MKHSDPIAAWQSQFATYARGLEASRLRVLRLDESTIVVAEVIVSICKLISDESNPQHWIDRIKAYFDDLESSPLESLIEKMMKDFQEDESKTWLGKALADMQDGHAQSWVDKYRAGGYRKFALRLLGSAQYRILVRALNEDAAIVALAIRRIVRSLMPFAIAWGDSVGMLTKDQLRAAGKIELAGVNAVHLIIEVDKFFGEKVLSRLPMEVTAANGTDLVAWTPDSTAGLMGQFRALVREASAQRVERANTPLLRKIQGARAALQYSEDGTSQAANSLIELIDRIMREAFSPHEVLAWIDVNIPEYPDVIYLDKGCRKPTKLGEALCFIYGGGPTARAANQYDDGEGPLVIHELVARAFVLTRNRLQKIKHADIGTPEEREQLLTLFSALEGALMLGLSIAKYSAASERPAA